MKKLTLITSLIFTTTLNAQLLNDAIVYFPFDGNVNDISNSSISATNNGMSYGTDREGTSNSCISNDGNLNYVSFNDNAVKPQLPITISVWVKLDAYETNIIYRSDNESNNYFGYWIICNNSGNIGMSISGGLGGSSSNNRRTFRTDETLSLNTWHHITGIIRSYDDMEVHIDCVKSTGSYSGTGATTMAYSNTESRIGADPNGFNFNGQIDELAIWDRELTPTEFNSLCRPENHLSITENNENKESIHLYPIPAGNFLNIDSSEGSFTKVLIVDASGRIIISKEKGCERISLIQLERGVYFVSVYDKNKLLVTRKIVKH